MLYLLFVIIFYLVAFQRLFGVLKSGAKVDFLQFEGHFSVWSQNTKCGQGPYTPTLFKSIERFWLNYTEWDHFKFIAFFFVPSICIDNHCPVYILIRIILVFNIQPEINRIIKKTLYTFIRALEIEYYHIWHSKWGHFVLVVRQTIIKYMFVVIRCFRQKLICTLS